MRIDPWTAVAVVAAAAVLLTRFRGGRRVSTTTVQQKIAAGATIVDVRTPEEFARGAYPGAVNIPLQALAGRMGLIPRDRAVVVYCASGIRSGSAERTLRQAGYADVTNAGGLGHMPR